MKSIEIIENVFETTFPQNFSQFWKSFLEDRVCLLKIYNYEDYYILNDLAIVELNTKKEDINVRSELNKLLKIIEQNPALRDFVPIAVNGLFDFYYSFLAFKKTNGVIKDKSIYRIFLFLDSTPEIIKVKKIASKYSDILGDEIHVHSILYNNQDNDKLILKASDNLYSHVFDRYIFLDSYLDSIAKKLNELFSIFNDISFFDEKGHTLYCEFAGVKSVIFKFEDEVMQPIENYNKADHPLTVLFNNITPILIEKLGEYSLHLFQWSFFRGDIPSFGLGLTTNNNLEASLDKYGMSFNKFD